MVVNTEQYTSGGLRTDRRRDAEDTNTAAIDEPGIVYCRLPDRFTRKNDYQSRIVLLIVNLAVLFFIALAVGLIADGAGSIGALFPCFFIAYCIPVWCITIFIICRYDIARGEAFKKAIRDRDRVSLRVLRGLQELGMFTIFSLLPIDRHEIRRLPEMIRSRVDSKARTIVHDRYREQLREIELHEHLLEPERIGQDRSQPAGCVGPIIVCIILFMSLVWFNSGQIMWVYVVWLLAILLGLRPIRDRVVRPILGESRLPIAAPGIVTDRKGRRWRFDDSIMLVRPASMGYFTASLIGPDGWLELYFRDTTYDQFRALWQRWNHPHPRPELLE